MPAVTLEVTFHEGYWRIKRAGEWYGAYADQLAATEAALGIVNSTLKGGGRVVVSAPDGSEITILDPLLQA